MALSFFEKLPPVAAIAAAALADVALEPKADAKFHKDSSPTLAVARG